MKIGIIGASGKAGSLILQEAVERGHEVTAIVRDASKIQNKQVHVVEKIFSISNPKIFKNMMLSLMHLVLLPVRNINMWKPAGF